MLINGRISSAPIQGRGCEGSRAPVWWILPTRKATNSELSSGINFEKNEGKIGQKGRFLENLRISSVICYPQPRQWFSWSPVLPLFLSESDPTRGHFWPILFICFSFLSETKFFSIMHTEVTWAAYSTGFFMLLRNFAPGLKIPAIKVLRVTRFVFLYTFFKYSSRFRFAYCARSSYDRPPPSHGCLVRLKM